MSTTLTHASPSISLTTPALAQTQAAITQGARSLSTLLLAAAVAALIVIAEQIISSWADGHLLLAWVLLWAVVFAGLALFAGTAKRVARRAIAGLDDWSRSMAQARAEMRMWEMARHDARLMGELMAARGRDDSETLALTPSAAAPIEAVAAADKGSYWERLARSRQRNAHLYYV